MFALFAAKESLQVWKVHYCNDRFEGCARLALARAGEPVPKGLLPNGKSLGGGAVEG